VAPNAQSPFISRADKIVTGVNFRGEEVSGVEQRTPARETVQRDLHLGNLLTRVNRGPSSQTLRLLLDDIGVLFNPRTTSHELISQATFTFLSSSPSLSCIRNGSNSCARDLAGTMRLDYACFSRKLSQCNNINENDMSENCKRMQCALYFAI